MSAKGKKNSKPKNASEKYLPPDVQTLDLTDESFLFKCALKNEFQSVCGAFDMPKEVHPLAAFIIEKNLFNIRDPYHRTVFDLACLVGSRDFLKAILERTAEKEKLNDESILNLREPLKLRHAYNYMHYACIWNRYDVVKFLFEQDKLIQDPELSELEAVGSAANQSQIQLSSTSHASMIANNKNQATSNMKPLGSFLLRSKTKYGETPIDLAKRYKHHHLVEYLTFAEKKQNFIDFVNGIKIYVNDTEKHQNKLAKDDKKKLENIYSETMNWFDKNRESTDIAELNEKIAEIESEVKPIYEKVEAILAAAREAQLSSTASLSVAGNMTSRSKASGSKI